MLNETKILTMIRNSAINRYAGELRKWEDFPEGGYLYTPMDEDQIRDLLAMLWGPLAHPRMIEQAFQTLITDGAQHWPKGWCQEDQEAEDRAKLFVLDHQIECAERYLRNLKRKARRLTERVQDADYQAELKAATTG